MDESVMIEKAVKVLRNGGILLYPTDTLIGLGCDALNSEAVKKIFELKGRDFKKPMSIACSDVEMVKEYADLSSKEEQILLDLLPGPYTFILTKNDKIPDTLTAGSKSVGVRIPNYPILLEVIQKLGRPIITTSANQSGQTDIKTLEECVYPVEFILSTSFEYAGPSTVFDIKNKTILREGIGLEGLKKYFNI